jgi:hypothetical protein
MWNTRDTVEIEMPAARATSVIVAARCVASRVIGR